MSKFFCFLKHIVSRAEEIISVLRTGVLWGDPIKNFYPEFFPEANWSCEDHSAQVFRVLYSSHSYINMPLLSEHGKLLGGPWAAFKRKQVGLLSHG
jgi:hypothetical protein